MAQKSAKGSSRGSVWFGLLLGVILGLGAAVAVALFVAKAPVPFLDKASRAPETPLTNVREAPDPNQGLAGRSQAPQTAPDPAANAAARASMTQDIDQLIASLSQGQASRAGSAPATPAAPAPAPDTQTAYYLQAGAFRSADDAEALKARILMLGLNSFVQPVQVDGTTLHRVRVGPFRGIDEMNRSRIALGRSNISSAVVRP